MFIMLKIYLLTTVLEKFWRKKDKPNLKHQKSLNNGVSIVYTHLSVGVSLPTG